MYRDTREGDGFINKNSRADYFKTRRLNQKQFNCALPREKVEQFESILEKRKMTKTEWLESKVDEEIRRDK